MKVVDSNTGQPYSAVQLTGTIQDTCTQFSCFSSFLASNTPMTAVLTRPPQYYPAQLTRFYTGAQLPFSVLLQSLSYYPPVLH